MKNIIDYVSQLKISDLSGRLLAMIMAALVIFGISQYQVYLVPDCGCVAKEDSVIGFLFLNTIINGAALFVLSLLFSIFVEFVIGEAKSVKKVQKYNIMTHGPLFFIVYLFAKSTIWVKTTTEFINSLGHLIKKTTTVDMRQANKKVE